MWLASPILLAACTTTGGVTDTFCQIAKPIYVSKHDILTAETARRLLAHNRKGQELCGWRTT